MTSLPTKKCIAVMGATATGKSALGVLLAGRFDGEVISMDSRQVYVGMDIGTGKVTAEEQGGIPHHLLDVLHPDHAGSAGKHAELTRAAIDEIVGRNRLPILVGGTGLYFDAVFRPLIDVVIPPDQLDAIRASFSSKDTMELYAELRGVDPDRARELSPNDRMRITRALEIHRATGVTMSEHLVRQASSAAGSGGLSRLKLVLTMPREKLRLRIAERTRSLYDAGWVQEVERLLEGDCRMDGPGMQSLGYQEIAAALAAGDDPLATVDAVTTRTQQYAKRQETYFRKEKDAEWLDVTAADYETRAVELTERFLEAS
jgi:tRNA dimethylallyltransferase